MVPSDSVVRAMTEDGAFRVVVATTTESARGAIAAQEAEGDVAVRLAELITGAVLLRETTAPGRRVQMVARAGGATFVADSLPDGTNRGILSEQVDAGPHNNVLQVSYSMPNGALHQGIIGLGAKEAFSETLMRYLQESEQVVATVAVSAVRGDGGLAAAGGYVVQLLPEADRDALSDMTAVLERVAPIAELLTGQARDAGAIVATLLGHAEHQQLASSALRFGCTCSKDRVLRGIASLPAEEIASMIEDGETLDVRCDACGTAYAITVAELGELT